MDQLAAVQPGRASHENHLVFPFTIPSAISSPQGNNTYLRAF